MSEKLSERMNRDGGHSTVYVPEVAALEQQLAAEQAAHDQIATICFRVGADTTDGTSISAVLSLADIVIDFRQQLAAKDGEIARLRWERWVFQPEFWMPFPDNPTPNPSAVLAETPAAPLTALALPEDDVPDAAPEVK